MQGIDILAVEQVAIDWGWSWPVFWKFFGIGLGACIIGGVLAAWFEQDWMAGMFAGLFSGILVGVFFGMLAGSHGTPIEFEDHYKVTISDEVSMNEFNERYEILDQEGLIFTIRDKEVER